LIGRKYPRKKDKKPRYCGARGPEREKKRFYETRNRPNPHIKKAEK